MKTCEGEGGVPRGSSRTLGGSLRGLRKVVVFSGYDSVSRCCFPLTTGRSIDLTFPKCDVELDRRPDFHQNSEGKPSKNRETLPSVKQKATTRLPRKSRNNREIKQSQRGKRFIATIPPTGVRRPYREPTGREPGFRITLDLRSAPTPSSPSQPSRPPPPLQGPPVPSPPLF